MDVLQVSKPFEYTLIPFDEIPESQLGAMPFPMYAFMMNHQEWGHPTAVLFMSEFGVKQVNEFSYTMDIHCPATPERCMTLYLNRNEYIWRRRRFVFQLVKGNVQTQETQADQNP